MKICFCTNVRTLACRPNQIRLKPVIVNQNCVEKRTRPFKNSTFNSLKALVIAQPNAISGGLCNVHQVPHKMCLSGDATLSLSCSDKIAKWVLLGVQGALLSNFLSEPLLLSSITVGTGADSSAASLQACQSALERAVQGSITNYKIATLPLEYCLRD